MQDLACLIAPRKFAAISGSQDFVFPTQGSIEGFETVKKIYKDAGVPDNCRFVTTPEGHFWCEDIVWNTAADMMK